MISLTIPRNSSNLHLKQRFATAGHGIEQKMRLVRDNSVLHVPCFEVAVSRVYLIDSHIIVIGEINESILAISRQVT